MAELSPPRIVCAALRRTFDYPENVLVCAPRHFDMTMHAQLARMGADGKHTEQGFIDQHGKFYSREEAWKIAEANGQIIRLVGGVKGRLYSENLY